MRDKLNNIWDKLDGKKSYIGAIIIFLAGGFRALDVLDEEMYKILLTLGGSVAVLGLRGAIARLRK